MCTVYELSWMKNLGEHNQIHNQKENLSHKKEHWSNVRVKIFVKLVTLRRSVIIGYLHIAIVRILYGKLWSLCDKDSVLKLFSTRTVFGFLYCDCCQWNLTLDMSTWSLVSNFFFFFTESELYKDFINQQNHWLWEQALLFNAMPLFVGFTCGPFWTAKVWEV